MPTRGKGLSGVPMLPVAPLVKVVERLIAAEQATHVRLSDTWPPAGEKNKDEICRELGFTSRTLYRWKNEDQLKVQFDTVDRVLINTNLHWWDVWPEDEYPKVHRAMNKSLKKRRVAS